MDAPALEHLEHCVSDRHLHMALAGRARYNTLKKCVKNMDVFHAMAQCCEGYTGISCAWRLGGVSFQKVMSLVVLLSQS